MRIIIKLHYITFCLNGSARIIKSSHTGCPLSPPQKYGCHNRATIVFFGVVHHIKVYLMHSPEVELTAQVNILQKNRTFARDRANFCQQNFGKNFDKKHHF